MGLEKQLKDFKRVTKEEFTKEIEVYLFKFKHQLPDFKNLINERGIKIYFQDLQEPEYVRAINWFDLYRMRYNVKLITEKAYYYIGGSEKTKAFVYILPEEIKKKKLRKKLDQKRSEGYYI